MDQNSQVKIDLHIHTNRTDGQMSVEEAMHTAHAAGLEVIAFTEHIAKEPTYSWFAFKQEIQQKMPEGLTVLVGVETKVLGKTGELNAPREVLESADIVLGAVHGAGHVEWLLQSPCDIIAHPQITDENLHVFKRCEKILEINPKAPYRLPFSILDQLVEMGLTFSFGSNAHVAEDIPAGQQYFNTIRCRHPDMKIYNPCFPF